MGLQQKTKLKNNGNRRGATLIEALVLLFVFSVATLSFYSVFSLGIRYITQSKDRTIAISLANEKMELLRNLSYDNVAIVGGIPNGSIDPDETVTVGDKSFHITTDIKYYDDSDDGTLAGSPTDAVPNDYKIAVINVAWGGESDNEKISLSTRFVPPGIESSAGGGALSLNAIDFSGMPVANVAVHLVNNNISPAVNYNTSTDANGNLLLQGVPADTGQNYEITLSKSNYETVKTYPPTGVGFVPKDVHMSVIEGILNNETLEMNLLSDLNLKSVDPFGTAIADASFDLVGGRRLDDGSSTAVYSYNSSETTDNDGEFSFSDESPGEYEVTITGDTDTDYEFWKLNPGVDENNKKVNVAPGTTVDADMILIDKTLDAVFVTVTDTDTGDFIENAHINLKNETLGYDVTLDTDKYGVAYFPATLDTPLQNGAEYQMKITADNYDSATDTVIVNTYTSKDITLTAN